MASLKKQPSFKSYISQKDTIDLEDDEVCFDVERRLFLSIQIKEPEIILNAERKHNVCIEIDGTDENQGFDDNIRIKIKGKHSQAAEENLLSKINSDKEIHDTKVIKGLDENTAYSLTRIGLLNDVTITVFQKNGGSVSLHGFKSDITHLFKHSKIYERDSRNGKYAIMTYKGDITKLTIDCIVNPTNSSLSPKGGVAGAIASSAAEGFARWCKRWVDEHKYLGLMQVIVSPGYKLYCNKILHVTSPSPRMTGGIDKSYDALVETIKNIVETANKEGCESIAIPPIGAGQGGIPAAIVTKAFLDAFKQLHADNKMGDLKLIAITDVKDDVLDLIKQELAKEPMRSMKASNWNSTLQRIQKCETLHRQNHTYSTTERQAAVRNGTTNGAGTSNTSQIRRKARLSLSDTRTQASFSDFPDTSRNTVEMCVICCDAITDKKTLPKCKHSFCADCIDQAFIFKPACPTCNMIYGPLTGNQPNNGNMDVTKDRESLPGYLGSGSIVIVYSFPNGRQGSEHPEPDRPYQGIRRTCYLPDNYEGNQVLSLLKEAFKARLTFTIGRSTTTGKEGVITWNDIHHKTNKTGGPQRFGYPDPDYLNRVKDELAAKGIQ